METRTESRAAPRRAADDGVASLTVIGLRRPTGRAERKDGDITSTLAAMPAAPEILAGYDAIDAMPGAEMRDVTPQAPRWRDIAEWWNALRQARPMPSRDQLSPSEVVSRWPHLVLFRCGAVPGQLQPDSAFSTALRANRDGNGPVLPGGSAEVTAMLSQWMVRVANRALASRAPVPDEARFDTATGSVACRLVALPFGPDQRPDHILCQIEIC